MKFYDTARDILRKIAGADHWYDYGPRVMGKEGSRDPLDPREMGKQMQAVEDEIKQTIANIEAASKKEFKAHD